MEEEEYEEAMTEEEELARYPRGRTFIFILIFFFFCLTLFYFIFLSFFLICSRSPVSAHLSPILHL